MRLPIIIFVFIFMWKAVYADDFKINDVKFSSNSQTMAAKLTFDGVMNETPEFSVKDKILQVAIKGTKIWPKIEKKVAVVKQFDTTLLVYQFDRDTVRFRVILPSNMPDLEKAAQMVVHNDSVEISWPVSTVVAAPKAVAAKSTWSEKSLDQAIAQKKLAETENNADENTSATEADVKKALSMGNESNATMVPSTKPRSLLTPTVSAPKEVKNNFSFATYIGKFVGFLCLVLVLFYGIAQLMRKGVLKKGRFNLFGDMPSVKVLSSTYVAPKKNLIMVQAHKQVFLIATSETGVHFLSEIKDTAELIKSGEQFVTGTNFDREVTGADNRDVTFKTKDNSRLTAELEALENESFMSDKVAPKIRDTVKFSDQIKSKVKNMKQLNN
jgi:flagellar biogenesis protein FliO